MRDDLGNELRDNSNRRQWGRYPSDKSEVTLTINDVAKVGTLIDESIGGVGLKFTDAMGIKEGDAVELNFRGELHEGRVMNVRPTSDGNYFVGVSWPGFRVDEDFGTQRRESAMFLNHRGLQIVCATVETACDGAAAVKLWNGATFQVPQDRITNMTSRERKAQLQGLGPKLKVLKELYDLETAEVGTELVEAVLDFEFTEQPEPAAN